ncbi:MAG: 23S rRNA (pseudouridine(1915)-N(3))-methyltransferase RlmH [Candidatus Saccharimonadales bacterium]
MIRVIAGGKKHHGWAIEAIHEYEKRMQKPYIYDWVFCDENRLEAKVSELKPQDFVILLDENGKELSSPDFSKTLQNQVELGKNVIFVIGGAFGHFPESIKSRANLTLSLSKMVLPHQICRVVLAEQLYRAQEIALERPYHHA